MIESRIAWRLNGEPPPEGWRCCISWFLEDGTRDTLYTNAPSDANPHDERYERVFVNYRPVRQERHVTEWVDVGDYQPPLMTTSGHKTAR